RMAASAGVMTGPATSWVRCRLRSTSCSLLWMPMPRAPGRWKSWRAFAPMNTAQSGPRLRCSPIRAWAALAAVARQDPVVEVRDEFVEGRPAWLGHYCRTMGFGAADNTGDSHGGQGAALCPHGPPQPGRSGRPGADKLHHEP